MSTVHPTLQQIIMDCTAVFFALYFSFHFFDLAEMDLTHATAALASLIKYLEVTLYFIRL